MIDMKGLTTLRLDVKYIGIPFVPLDLAMYEIVTMGGVSKDVFNNRERGFQHVATIII